MATFEMVYVREQRVYFEIEADDEDTARGLADEHVATLDLDCADDESDDEGEIEVRSVDGVAT